MSSSAETNPVVSATPTSAAVVTLPGFTREPAWVVDDVAFAAAFADRVVTVTSSSASVLDVATGSVLTSTPLPGGHFGVLSGTVAGLPAAAAVSDVQALVWVDDAVAPLVIDLTGGQRLISRTGALMVVGTDRSFALVTATGVVPVVAPRPEMIVLGVSAETVLWAGSPHQVVIAAANGTPLREISLAVPGEGATITPKVGWVRAATGTSVVVGWTLADGSNITGVHSAATGELLAQVPGTGEGLLSADGAVWVTDGHLVDLSSSTSTPLPDGFVASRFLGDALYGALPTGDDALLRSGKSSATAVEAATVRPVAIADDTLLTLTGGTLAGYPTAP